MADKISITICGDGGCGKSSITLRLVRSQWTHEYDPTIEDSYSVTRHVDGLPYLLSLTDTAGQEEYRGLWAASNLSSDAFLLVYDITNPHSLDNLTYFLDMIDIEAEHRQEENLRIMREYRARGKSVPDGRLKSLPVKIVAGNKCDLKDSRVVSSRVGLEWARGKGCGFMETSAREMVNIEETFALIVRRVVEARRSNSGAGSPTSPGNPAQRQMGLSIPQPSTMGHYGLSPVSVNSNSGPGQSPSMSTAPLNYTAPGMEADGQRRQPTLSERLAEKSGFDDDENKRGKWKKLSAWFRCGCFGR